MIPIAVTAPTTTTRPTAVTTASPGAGSRSAGGRRRWRSVAGRVHSPQRGGTRARAAGVAPGGRRRGEAGTRRAGGRDIWRAQVAPSVAGQVAKASYLVEDPGIALVPGTAIVGRHRACARQQLGSRRRHRLQVPQRLLRSSEVPLVWLLKGQRALKGLGRGAGHPLGRTRRAMAPLASRTTRKILRQRRRRWGTRRTTQRGWRCQRRSYRSSRRCPRRSRTNATLGGDLGPSTSTRELLHQGRAQGRELCRDGVPRQGGVGLKPRKAQLEVGFHLESSLPAVAQLRYPTQPVALIKVLATARAGQRLTVKGVRPVPGPVHLRRFRRRNAVAVQHAGRRRPSARSLSREEFLLKGRAECAHGGRSRFARVGAAWSRPPACHENDARRAAGARRARP